MKVCSVYGPTAMRAYGSFWRWKDGVTVGRRTEATWGWYEAFSFRVCRRGI